jgi:hypothetical protein
MAQQLELKQPELRGIDHDNLVDAFARIGERPQFLRKACAHAQSGAGSAEAFDIALRVYAQGQRERDRAEMTHAYLQLTPLQQAVMQRLLEQGNNYRPYDAAALKFYQSFTGEAVNAGQVQTALNELRDSKARLVWKPFRGNYALYDEGLNEWYAYLKNARQWPPQ